MTCMSVCKQASGFHGSKESIKSSIKKDLVEVIQSQNDSLNILIEERMKKHTLKGLSVAVFKDYKIIWTKEYGYKASDSDARIDANTAFSTASISKPITAILCGILDEKGLINLDAPISKYLKSWNLPKSEYTKNVDVTWIHLLSHMAGINQGGFQDYYEGD